MTIMQDALRISNIKLCSLYVNNIFTKGENLKIEMCCFEFYKWPSVNIATTDNKKKTT